MEEGHIQIYKGQIYTKKPKKDKKIVAFDLDETIGSFSHLHILWKAIMRFGNASIKKEQESLFFNLMEMFPEFLRYNIINILKYLCKKKENKIIKLYLYTNNKCGSPWVEMIIKYLEKKVNHTNIFEKTICAFKIRNKIIEINRTSNDKKVDDFINCTMIPKNSQICFIDNSYYQEMINDNVYYIQPRPYYHGLNISNIIYKFIHSDIGHYIINESTLKDSYSSFLIDWFEFNRAEKYIITNERYNVDEEIEISRKIMYHIKEFILHRCRNKTAKKIQKYIYTRKNHN